MGQSGRSQTIRSPWSATPVKPRLLRAEWFASNLKRYENPIALSILLMHLGKAMRRPEYSATGLNYFEKKPRLFL